jgi:predicted DsbA family dithiol-disulfide isomerase
MELKRLFSDRNVDIRALNRQMKSVMDREGLPYNERTSTFNSRLAQELAKWAEGRPHGELLHQRIFRAYFVDGKNIGNPELLIEIAEQAGLSALEAREALETRRFRDAVNQDWKRCRDFGVTAVPTFMTDGSRLVGAQPYEELERFMLKGVPAV